MKNILLSISAAIVLSLSFLHPLSLASTETLRLSEPVASDSKSETFGSIIDTSLPLMSLQEAFNNSEQYLGKKININTRIAKVCQKKGCFFIAQEDKLALRVSFKDYSFFVPTDSSNKNVTLMGKVVKIERSQADAKHFNQDLRSNTQEIPSGVVYEIIAEGVKIPLS